MKTTLFHITSQAEAEAALAAGSYLPAGFAAERFIHCSYARQLLKVAELHFPGRDDLVLLEIERAELTCPVVDENLEGGAELFPHIYGELPMTAVIRIHPFPRNADGRLARPPLEVYDA